MSSLWLEVGNRYVTYGGAITTRLFRTPVSHVFGDTFKFAGYIGDDTQLHCWNGMGDTSRYGRTDLTLVDEADDDQHNEEKQVGKKNDTDFEFDISFMFDVKLEVVQARQKFTNLDLAHAMTEEFGEVIKALMDQKQKGKVTNEEIYKECVQAAAMAMRLATEGDPCFPGYIPPTTKE
jgi:hypothetical protein